MDLLFDPVAWLTRFTGRNIAKTEGIAFVSGNGTNKPTGLTGTAPEANAYEDSPPLTFGALQYIPTGVPVRSRRTGLARPLATRATLSSIWCTA